MKEFFKKNWQILCIFLVSLAIFFPSLSVFYTNDDFFLLKISNAGSVKEFLNFFNILHGPDGLGMYRPLTTQVFYFLAHQIPNLNPMPLHVISFLFLFGIIYLVYKLTLELLTKFDIQNSRSIALTAAFLYAVSATHFAHLYYLATFQELGMTLFVLLTCLMFLKKKYLSAFIFFVLALMSKETAVITPALLVLIHYLEKFSGQKVVSFKKLLFYLLPYVICLFAYSLIRLFSYGFATGDSYIWDFSINKFVNTIMWYFLWSFNIPESIVDFIGPGLHVNPNLFKYWSKEVISIFILVASQCLILVWMYLKLILAKAKEKVRKIDSVSIFCIAWFVITILPVAFLPIHKFTFYLTLPLIGIVIRIGYLFAQTKITKFVAIIFIALWTVTSILTLRFTYETNWITQSGLVASRVNEYIKNNEQNFAGKTIYFSDTLNDLVLPWSPTATVKTALSDKNFFEVFYPSLSAKINYGGPTTASDSAHNLFIGSRQFLGY